MSKISRKTNLKVRRSRLIVFSAGLAVLATWAVFVSRPANAIFTPKPGPFPREGDCNLADPFFDEVRHTLNPDRNIGPGTLKGLPVPEPAVLAEYVRDRDTAILLGKALFWDMQVGSDGIQACASCHFRAGADPRSKNQVSPGGVGDTAGLFDLAGPNGQLTTADFPLHKFLDRFDRTSPVLASTNDVISSQGVFHNEFVSVRPGKSADRTRFLPDPIFNVNGTIVRRVEPRNTPTMINAVFNLRNFWDGRADNIFNGVNEFGARDPNARVVRADSPDSLEFVTVRIDTASLASQAVGPPMSIFEMGSERRNFRNIGKRLVSAIPLRQQRIHPNDSVFRGHIRNGGRGLRQRYSNLIRQAFEPVWWDSDKIVVVDSDGTAHIADGPSQGHHLAANEYTAMESNFSLFFGLAIQMYETTLVSDDAKIDRHFDSVNAGGPGLLNATELAGMELFNKAACVACHSGPEFSNATVRTLATGFENPNVSPSFQGPEQIERMVLGTCEIGVYDQGFYNIGVRPWEEDPGIGSLDPFGNPLAISDLITADPATIPSQELLTIHYPQISDVTAVPPIAVGERTSGRGAFKIPSLRNVALTAPYFHNGGQLTLRQVIEFYNRGGDFHDHVGPDDVPQTAFMDFEIGRLELTNSEIDELVAFLETLTDPRVVDQAAPFDHPELLVPNGQEGDSLEV